MSIASRPIISQLIRIALFATSLILLGDLFLAGPPVVRAFYDAMILSVSFLASLRPLRAFLSRQDEEIRRLSKDLEATRAQEEQLRESERLFQQAFTHAPHPMGLINLDGYLIEINNAATERLKATREQLIGSHLSAITHPDDRETSVAYYKALISGDITHYTLRKRYLCADGMIRYGLLSVAARIGPNGEITGAVSHVIDLTDEVNQKHLASGLMIAADNIPQFILVLSTGGHILHANRTFREWICSEPEHQTLIALQHSQTRAVAAELCKDHLWQGHEWEGELSFRDSKGQMVEVEAHFWPIVDPDFGLQSHVAVLSPKNSDDSAAALKP